MKQVDFGELHLLEGDRSKRKTGQKCGMITFQTEEDKADNTEGNLTENC